MEFEGVFLLPANWRPLAGLQSGWLRCSLITAPAVDGYAKISIDPGPAVSATLHMPLLGRFWAIKRRRAVLAGMLDR